LRRITLRQFLTEPKPPYKNCDLFARDGLALVRRQLGTGVWMRVFF
jgi:hypothetical protein